ncbi:hypothetical protein [Clostridium aminobutyricum]|uniref:Uncharacterized protein n=1 Tax=Clostridium aminobutyricum TaxID=33953 RepID=A0A939D9Q7_CLOAM|nr:hypothetical protein [Clostridium aminobutyricum]MBN7773715.1 hypothetical protein [Clostridium aminobutyricum]
MDSFTATNKVLDNLKLKYRYVDNIMNLTKDLEQAILSNDTVSLGAILDMRGNVMEMVDKLDSENREIASHLPSPLRERIESIIIPKKEAEPITLDNPLETNIYDTNKRIGALLAKIIKLDTALNQKVSGRK